MDQETFRKRINKLLAEDRNNPLSWWYLSYAGDDGFHGSVIIQAHGRTEAPYLCRHRGLSPGGQVLILPIPEEMLPPDEYRNRLLTKEELEAIWKGDMKTLGELEEEEGSDA